MDMRNGRKQPRVTCKEQLYQQHHHGKHAESKEDARTKIKPKVVNIFHFFYKDVILQWYIMVLDSLSFSFFCYLFASLRQVIQTLGEDFSISLTVTQTLHFPEALSDFSLQEIHDF